MRTNGTTIGDQTDVGATNKWDSGVMVKRPPLGNIFGRGTRESSANVLFVDKSKEKPAGAPLGPGRTEYPQRQPFSTVSAVKNTAVVCGNERGACGTTASVSREKKSDAGPSFVAKLKELGISVRAVNVKEKLVQVRYNGQDFSVKKFSKDGKPCASVASGSGAAANLSRQLLSKNLTFIDLVDGLKAEDAPPAKSGGILSFLWS